MTLYEQIMAEQRQEEAEARARAERYHAFQLGKVVVIPEAVTREQENQVPEPARDHHTQAELDRLVAVKSRRCVSTGYQMKLPVVGLMQAVAVPQAVDVGLSKPFEHDGSQGWDDDEAVAVHARMTQFVTIVPKFDEKTRARMAQYLRDKRLQDEKGRFVSKHLAWLSVDESDTNG